MTMGITAIAIDNGYHCCTTPHACTHGKMCITLCFSHIDDDHTCTHACPPPLQLSCVLSTSHADDYYSMHTRQPVSDYPLKAVNNFAPIIALKLKK